MNQILSVDMPRNNRNTKKKANINSVIIFFCIILLIFGVLMIVIGIISNKNNNTGNTVNPVVTTGPEIEIIPGTSKLKITATGESSISSIVYKWNNGEEITVNDTDELEINIPVGTNILTVSATDENGQTTTYQEEFVGAQEYIPTVELIQKENEDMMAIRYSSDKIVKQIAYYFDDEEKNINEVNSLSGEIPVLLIGGKHNFTVEITNVDEEKFTEQHELNAPTISAVTDGEKFIIEVEDTSENGITSVVVIMNDNRTEKKVNNEKTYKEEIELENGENRLIVIVRNSENALTTKRVRFKK